MARFYFHVLTPASLQIDVVGVEFSDHAEARRHAVLGARDLLAEMASEHDISRWQIEVTDADGVLVASVPFSDAAPEDGVEGRGGGSMSLSLV